MRFKLLIDISAQITSKIKVKKSFGRKIYENMPPFRGKSTDSSFGGGR